MTRFLTEAERLAIQKRYVLRVDLEKLRKFAEPADLQRIDAEIKSLQEMNVEKRLGTGLFADKINDPADLRVSKSIREFLPDGEQELDSVAEFLDSVTAQSEDATVAPQYSPTPNFNRGEHVPFAGDGHGQPLSMTPKPYLRDDFVGAQPAVRLGNNYVLPNADPGIAPPSQFVEPEPGRNPADGPAPVDYDEDGTPIFGYDGDDVSKRHGITRHAVRKGRKASLFGNLIQPRGTDGNAGV